MQKGCLTYVLLNISTRHGTSHILSWRLPLQLRSRPLRKLGLFTPLLNSIRLMNIHVLPVYTLLMMKG